MADLSCFAVPRRFSNYACSRDGCMERPTHFWVLSDFIIIACADHMRDIMPLDVAALMDP